MNFVKQTLKVEGYFYLSGNCTLSELPNGIYEYNYRGLKIFRFETFEDMVELINDKENARVKCRVFTYDQEASVMEDREVYIDKNNIRYFSSDDNRVV